MCGIAGILNFSDSTRHTVAIQSMTDRIAHRGPDAEGIYVDERIALGHRRLAIIDLNESANQPMWDFSGRYVIVFNGEIYNYQDIKSRLRDYPFKTQSDTEVILAAYATWGINCLEQMNGMFAFAIWDAVEEVLFIARDRVGKKPFYYALNRERFVFSSEVRSMLASGLIPRQLEDNYLTEYLMYQAAMNEHTMVKGISRLKAGYYAILHKGTLTELPYWEYSGVRPSADSYETAKGKVKDLMLDAVRLRMVSDVPVGAFLSGGIDSSLVVASMAEQSSAPINTFTISFDEKQYDEAVYAQQVATIYKTNHHRILIQPEEFLYSMEDILASMDTPSGDGPNTFLVAKYTRQANIKVALTGLGGDELFAGYNKFMIYLRLMKYKWLLNFPAPIRQSLAKMFLASNPDHKFTKAANLADLDKWDLSTVYPVLRRAYSQSEINNLLTKPNRHDGVEGRLSEINAMIPWMGNLSKCTIGELETYTRDVLLRDTDQMSMAHALEVRVPFFDYRLIEYVLSLPDHIKYPHTPKQLLVEAMAPRLPKELSQRKKMGFTLPMEQWLKRELADMVQLKLNDLADRKEFNGAKVLQNGVTLKQEIKIYCGPASGSWSSSPIGSSEINFSTAVK
ncbi:MAG: asparagine synthase (glutamine-hydrolyzing) [Saprospiraceae bacterium]|nr:asparagine synthase (glutamine-hydrolyzing) [Candidatus Opimibacter iunctus]